MTDAYATRLTADDVAVGDQGPTVTFEEISRVDIVKYAGASGDFNPIHVDETFATDAGHPSVFAHGMLTAGVAAELVADWFGLDRVESYSVRFTSRVWPGDTITATGEIVAVDSDEDGLLVEAELAVTNQDGEEVLTGSATAKI